MKWNRIGALFLSALFLLACSFQATAQEQKICQDSLLKCIESLSAAQPELFFPGPDKVLPYASPHEAAVSYYFNSLFLVKKNEPEEVIVNGIPRYIRTKLEFSFQPMGTPQNMPQLDKTKTLSVYVNSGTKTYPRGKIVSYEAEGIEFQVQEGVQYFAWMNVRTAANGDYEGSFAFGLGGVYKRQTETIIENGIPHEMDVLIPENPESITNPMYEYQVAYLRYVMGEYTPHIMHREVPSRIIRSTSPPTEAEPPVPPAPFCVKCYNEQSYTRLVKGDPNTQINPSRPPGEAVINIFVDGAGFLSDNTRKAIDQAILHMNRTFDENNKPVSTGFYFRRVLSESQTNYVIRANGFNEDKLVQVVKDSVYIDILVQEKSTASAPEMTGQLVHAFVKMLGLAPTPPKGCPSAANPPKANGRREEAPIYLTDADIKAIQAVNNPELQRKYCKEVRKKQSTTAGKGGLIVIATDPTDNRINVNFGYSYCVYDVERTYWTLCEPLGLQNWFTAFLPACRDKVIGYTDVITAVNCYGKR